MRERKSISRPAFLRLAVFMIAAVQGCQPETPPLDSTSQTYAQAVSAFYAGLAAMEVGADKHAETKLLQVTRLVPQEPAAWANLGVLALRRNEFDAAAERLEKAGALAPQNSRVQVFLWLLESNRGRLDEGMAHLRRAIELDSTNLRAMYALAQEIERQGAADVQAEIERWLNKILLSDPDNIAVLVEVLRHGARWGDGDKLRGTVAQLAELAPAWPIEAQEQLDALQAAVSRSDFRLAGTLVAFLRNVLLTVAAYRQDLAAVQTPVERVGEPIERFLWLPESSATPAPPDDSLTFAIEPLLPSDTEAWAWTGAVLLRGEGMPAVLVANGREVEWSVGRGRGARAALPFPGRLTAHLHAAVTARDRTGPRGCCPRTSCSAPGACSRYCSRTQAMHAGCRSQQTVGWCCW